jgi:DedD protein
MAEAQDVNLLRRRGRRRLVGAIALVLLAAIILPMVFDPEPKPGVPPVSVRIPGEDETPFAPKVAPKVAPGTAVPAAAESGSPAEASAKGATKPAERPPAAAPLPMAEAAPKAKAAAPTPAAPKAPAPASAAPAAPAEQFVVPVVALAAQEKVQEVTARLKAARLPYYTEPVATAKGSVTRVRVGPYGTREAAEDAHRELRRLGFSPGNVIVKS